MLVSRGRSSFDFGFAIPSLISKVTINYTATARENLTASTS